MESQGEAAQGEAAPPLTHTRAAPISQCLNGTGDLAMAHAFSLGDRVLFNPKVISGDVGFFSLVTSMDSQEQGAVWEVIRTLPPPGTPYQYHIRSN